MIDQETDTMTRGVAYATSCPGVDIKTLCDVLEYTCIKSGQCGVDNTMFSRAKSSQRLTFL